MSDHTFYSPEHRRNERELRLLDCRMNVGKEPTKEKRITMNLRMVLSGISNAGSPEWLDNAYVYVSKNHDPIFPTIEFRGYDLEFSSSNLFGPKAIGAPGTMMRGFAIKEIGGQERPDVVVEFAVRMPFSRKRWNWFGEMCGDAVWVKFTAGEAGTSTDKGDDDEPEDKTPDLFEGKDGDEPAAAVAAPKRSHHKANPSDALKQYHEKVASSKPKKAAKKK